MSVSFVIPTFNRGALVAEAAAAALSEAAAVGGEVVVVDDGSTDDTPERLGALPLRYLWTENRGVSAARNLGIAEARHPFIRFLDSDDLPVPGGTKALLEGIGAAQVAVGLCGERIGERLEVSRNYGFENVAEGEVRFADVVAGRVLTVASLVRRESLIGIGGFDEQSRFAEDYDLVIRGWAAGWTGKTIPQLVYEVRHAAGARLTRTAGMEQYRYFAGMMARNAERLEGAAGYDSAARAAFGQMLWRNGRGAARIGYRAEAERLFEIAHRVAGASSRVGSPVFLALAAVFGPYRAETLAMKAKSLARRS